MFSKSQMKSESCLNSVCLHIHTHKTPSFENSSHSATREEQACGRNIYMYMYMCLYTYIYICIYVLIEVPCSCLIYPTHKDKKS